MKIINLSIAVCLLVALSACAPELSSTDSPSAKANPAAKAEISKPYSPYVKQNFPTRVFWGDTHLHTELSQDAFTFGVTLKPEDAYRYARGDTVTATHGEPARIDRPLDFLVVSEQAVGFG